MNIQVKNKVNWVNEFQIGFNELQIFGWEQVKLFFFLVILIFKWDQCMDLQEIIGVMGLERIILQDY